MRTAILSSIPEAIKDYKAGKMLIVVDDEDRENEGDLVLAAEKTTPAKINFLSREEKTTPWGVEALWAMPADAFKAV